MADAAVTVAVTPLNVTMLFAAVELNPFPVMVISDPATPDSGLKSVTTGGITKSAGDIADILLVITSILPVTASAGTVTFSEVAVASLTVATMLENFTVLFAAVASKFLPLMVTTVPGSPTAGEKLVIEGPCCGSGSSSPHDPTLKTRNAKDKHVATNLSKKNLDMQDKI